jgi:hypothetical protein
MQPKLVIRYDRLIGRLNEVGIACA